MVEQVVLRCLQNEASQRPTSAREIAAALPGGDPLIAAMAAGETPSPKMIAAAGAATALPMRTGLLLLLSLAVGLFTLCLLAGSTFAINQAEWQDPPAVLAAEANELITEDLGYDDLVGDSIYGFQTDPQGSMQFWYRQRPAGQLLFVTDFWAGWAGVSYARPTAAVPSYEVPGELGIELNPNRRLQWFRKLPEIAPTSPWTTPAKELPWSTWFPEEKTGFRLSSFGEHASANVTSSTPLLEVVQDRVRTPPDASDAVCVWKGIDPETGQEFFVEAAAYQGRPVYYQRFTAEQFLQHGKPEDEESAQTELGHRFVEWLYLGVIIIGIGLTVMNLLSGRADRRGALRLVLVVFFLEMTVWLTHANHIAGGLESVVWTLGFAQATQIAALLAIWYVAMEPFVRKIWPQVMIAWQRLLDGRISDPLVGRDLLLGILGGVLCAICRQLSTAVQLWQSGSTENLMPVNPVSLMGPFQLLGTVLEPVTSGLSVALFGLVMLVFFRATLITKRRAIAAFFIVVFAIKILLGGGNIAVAWLPLAAWASLIVFVLVRIGLLARVVQLVMIELFLGMPLTLDPGHWYFGQGMLVVSLVFCLGLYGFYTAVGGRTHFAKMLAGN